MRLQITENSKEHKDLVTAVTWTPKNELVTASDDGMMLRWSMDGEMQAPITKEVDFAPTSLSWFPSVGKAPPDMVAVACADGTYRFISKAGREEKKVQAHHGAVISIRWNYDGSALLTAGEDGYLKVWSKTGNLRNTLANTGAPIYAFMWGPDNDQVGRGFIRSVRTSRSLGRRPLVFSTGARRGARRMTLMMRLRRADIRVSFSGVLHEQA